MSLWARLIIDGHHTQRKDAEATPDPRSAVDVSRASVAAQGQGCASKTRGQEGAFPGWSDRSGSSTRRRPFGIVSKMRVGVVGAGQLARMTYQAGISLG